MNLFDRPVYLLIGGFSVIIAVFALMVGIGYTRMSTIEHNFDDVVNSHSVQATLASKMIFLARERILLMNQIVTNSDPFERDQLFIEFRHKGAEFIKARNKILSIELHDEERELFEQSRIVLAPTVQILYEVWELSVNEELDTAQAVLHNDAIPEQEKAIALLQHFIHIQQSYNQSYLEKSTTQIRETIFLLMALMFLIVILCIGLGLLLFFRFNSLSNRLRHSAEQLQDSNDELQEKITTLKLRDDELRKSEARERVIRNSAMNAIITIDVHGLIETCNPSALDMYGYEEDELIGKNVSLLMPETYAQSHDKHVSRYRESGKDHVFGVTRDLQGKRKDGSLFPLDIAINKANVDGHILIVGVMRDITKQREAEDALLRSRDELEDMVKQRTAELETANTRLLQMASYDQLTSLPNRSLLQEHMKLAIAHARRHEHSIAVLFMDLDGFKAVNDSLGHEMGDLLLQEAGSRLQQSIRATDSAARFGGDEFVVLLTEISSADDVINVTEDIIRILSKPFDLGGHEIIIGVSIGISIFPHDGNTMNELINRADQAMYQVKKAGKNGYQLFTPLNQLGLPHQQQS